MKHLETIVIDDLDGTPDAETVTFAIDGQVYTIDLSAEHDADLHRALAPFVRAGTRTGRLLVRRRAAKRTGSPRRHEAKRNASIRDWAKSAGMHVAARGRLPSAVVAAFLQSQAQPASRFGQLHPQRRTAMPVAEAVAGQEEARPPATQWPTGDGPP
ncbi:Lsr2 family protein [Glycomyces sp. NPDC047369]